MEYTMQNMQRTIKKIKNEENLSWKQMAELFGFKNRNTINQYATGTKALSAESFRKHFGAIEQYWKNEAKKPKVEHVEAVAEEKPAEKPQETKEDSGIVLSCETIVELVKLLNVVGYRMEVIKK